jgi:hypothetical protein
MKMAALWDVPLFSLSKYTDVSEVLVAFITFMVMPTAKTSETSVNMYHTRRRNIPDDTRHYIRHRDDLKSLMKLPYLLSLR